MPLDLAVIDAGAVRFRPMALTASAVAVGSAVILFDPIFQGLAISLMAGEVASLLLSRITVPVQYHLLGTRRLGAPNPAAATRLGERCEGITRSKQWIEPLPSNAACVSSLASSC